MLRGLYDFKPINAKTLGFKVNDTLLFLSPHSKDKNWLNAANINGKCGLVPINYVDIRETTEDFFLTILDHAIKTAEFERYPKADTNIIREIRQDVLKGQGFEKKMRLVAKELSELKLKSPLEFGSTTNDASSIRTQGSTATQSNGHKNGLNGESSIGKNHKSTESVNNSVKEPPRTTITISDNDCSLPSTPSKKNQAPLPPLGGSISPSDLTNDNMSVSPNKNQSRLAGELVDAVRNSTGLSHEKSQTAVQTVLMNLQNYFQGHHIVDELQTLISALEKPCAIRNYPALVSKSSDATNLREIFRKLTEHKDDQQQRSWALFEDEEIIIELIAQLNTILKNADHSISKHVMNGGGYNNVHSLALYYQMETRWSIRSILLDSFAYIASIDAKALSVLLNSILPMELAREMVMDSKNKERICLSASLLGVLMSTGEGLPITHYEHLGARFVDFILDTIESPPDDDEKITDTFVNLILAYNLHFTANDENLTIQALAERKNAKVFTQKIIYLLNWEVDPVAVTAHEPKPENSVFKLMTNIFACSKTADLFYTNDVKVLIDIVTRCLTDLGAGDKRRTSYLGLIRVVLRNTNYADHLHRRDDLLKSFTSILCEEDPLSVTDKNLIRDITKEFPIFVK